MASVERGAALAPLGAGSLVWILRALGKALCGYLTKLRAFREASAFVKHAVGVALHDAAGWEERLAIALQETGDAPHEEGTRVGRRGMRVTVPATALAHAIRSPARQARLARLIRR